MTLSSLIYIIYCTQGIQFENNCVRNGAESLHTEQLLYCPGGNAKQQMLNKQNKLQIKEDKYERKENDSSAVERSTSV